MSDDLGRLRQTMSDLAEHGGSTDLYQRVLHRSHRLSRRRAITSTSAVAAAVLAVGIPVALIQQRSGPPPVVPQPHASIVATPSPAASSPAPSTPRTSAPQPSAPQSSDRPPSAPPSHSAARLPAANGCPVSASTLQKVAKLSAGWTLDRSSVRCKDNWAIAAPIAPSPERQGDGVVYFKYSASTGKWRNMGQGSAVECGAGSQMGVPASTGFCSPG